MIGKIIAAFFTSILARIATIFGAYWLGKKAAERKELKADVEAAFRIAEGAAVKPADRAELSDIVRRGDW